METPTKLSSSIRRTYSIRKINNILKELQARNNPLPEKYRVALARYDNMSEKPMQIRKSKYKPKKYEKQQRNKKRDYN